MISTAAMVLAVRLIGSVIVLGANLIVVRLLGAANYGAAVFILSAVSIASVLAVGGSKKLLIRNVGMLEVSEVEQRARIFSISLRTTALLFVPCSILLAIVILIKEGNSLDALVACLLLGLTCAKVLSESYLLGRSRPLVISVFDNLVRPILQTTILVTVVLSLNFIVDKNVYLYSVLGTLAMIVLLQFWILIESSLKSCTLTDMKDWVVQGLPFIVISASLTLQNNADIVMLGFMRSDTEAGLYAVASRVSTTLLFGLSAVNLVYAPLISRYYKNEKFECLQDIVAKSSLLSAAFAILAGLIALLYADKILFIFGSEFTEAKTTFQILVVATMISALCGPVGTLLTMTNFAGKASHVVVTATVLNVVLNLLLIPSYGVLGAAVATVCSLAFWNIAMLFLVYRRINVACGIFSVRHIFRTYAKVNK